MLEFMKQMEVGGLQELDKMDQVDSSGVHEEPKDTQNESPNDEDTPDYAQNDEKTPKNLSTVGKLQTYLSLESQNGGIRNSEVGERQISENIHTKQASQLFLGWAWLLMG